MGFELNTCYCFMQYLNHLKVICYKACYLWLNNLVNNAVLSVRT